MAKNKKPAWKRARMVWAAAGENRNPSSFDNLSHIDKIRFKAAMGTKRPLGSDLTGQKKNKKKGKGKLRRKIARQRAAAIAKAPAGPKHEYLDTRAREAGYEDYPTYLQSEHWLSVRAEYSAEWPGCACVGCRDPHYQLHHVTYERLGCEWLEDLVPLCHECHEKLHKFHRRTRTPLAHVRAALMQTFRWDDGEANRRLEPYVRICLLKGR